jgi:arylsulfatase A-like enzyme
VRVPGVVSWPGMIGPRASDGLFDQLDLFATFLRMAGADDAVPDDRYVDSIDQTSFLLADGGESNRKFHYYWLVSTFSALRVGEYKYMMASTSDDETDVVNPGGFTGVTQQYSYGRLFNLYLDPKETHSYMVRKLVYIELLTSAVGAHLRTFSDWPNRPAMISRPS